MKQFSFHFSSTFKNLKILTKKYLEQKVADYLKPKKRFSFVCERLLKQK